MLVFSRSLNVIVLLNFMNIETTVLDIKWIIRVQLLSGRGHWGVLGASNWKREQDKQCLVKPVRLQQVVAFT